jgi:hypothetical protein
LLSCFVWRGVDHHAQGHGQVVLPPADEHADLLAEQLKGLLGTRADCRHGDPDRLLVEGRNIAGVQPMAFACAQASWPAPKYNTSPRG